jgi:multiple sugar transport system ATP-binding protein
MASITFDDVTKTYGDGHRAVSDLNLEVQDAEFVVLVGPSGCGKTTALRMIAGLEEISGGQIRIGERVVNNLPPGARDIAMVFQNYALYPHMTVAENIGFALRMRKVPKAEARRRIEETARIIGLLDHLDRTPACRDGTRNRARATGLPHGRAALEPRREASGSDARRDLAHPATARCHDRIRHPRSGRGDDDG